MTFDVELYFDARNTLQMVNLKLRDTMNFVKLEASLNAKYGTPYKVAHGPVPSKEWTGDGNDILLFDDPFFSVTYTPLANPKGL